LLGQEFDGKNALFQLFGFKQDKWEALSGKFTRPNDILWNRVGSKFANVYIKIFRFDGYQ